MCMLGSCAPSSSGASVSTEGAGPEGRKEGPAFCYWCCLVTDFIFLQVFGSLVLWFFGPVGPEASLKPFKPCSVDNESTLITVGAVS